MNKKILHLSPTDIRYDSRILKELKAVQKIENTTLAAYGIDDSEGHKYDTEHMPFIKVFNIATKKLKFLPRPILYFLNLVESILVITPKAIAYKPKVIHCHDTLYLPIALITKLFCGSKLIYDAHELESDKAGQSKILSKYTLFIEKLAWKKIDFLISVSPSIIKWYDDNLGFKPSELIMNSPELDNKLDANKSDYLRNKYNIPHDKKIFIYLGIISKEGRGVDFYLNVFQKPDINSHIIFIGYGEYANFVKKIAEKHENIHYHEAVPHHKVVEISKSADVGLCLIEPVSLSDYYSLPNKLFEYAFSNLYIVSSDLPDIKEIVNDYKLGTCTDLNIEKIHSTIKELENQELKVNNDFNSLYKLSWNYQSEKLKNIYKNINKIN